MIQVLLLLFGARAYGPGVVKLDTVSVVVPMAEFRRATAKLVDDSLANLQVQKLDSACKAYAVVVDTLKSALEKSKQAGVVERKATETADVARVDNVKACAAIKDEAEKSSFRRGLAWGTGVMTVVSIATFIVGYVVGTAR